MINERQYQQLLKPLNPSRVAKRSQAGRSLSYLEAWDVKAHLIRIFGFGGWDWNVTTADLAFEQQSDGKWNVGYKVIGTLTIPQLCCSYTEAAIGTATLPQRGEAHDMAVKTAESDALKRAAINLGTQFGLSLYADGSLKDVVGATLDKETEIPQSEPLPPTTDNESAAAWIEEMKHAIDNKNVELLLAIQADMTNQGVLDYLYQGQTLALWMQRALAKAAE